MNQSALRASASLALLLCNVLSCGKPKLPPPASPASASSAAPAQEDSTPYVAPREGPIPSLRSGPLPPVELPGTGPGRVVSRYQDERFETLEIETDQDLRVEWTNRGHQVVAISPADRPHPLSFVGPSSSEESKQSVWVRRPLKEAGQSLEGDVYLPAHREPGGRLHFRVADTTAPASSPATLHKWARAWVRHVTDSSAEHPWYSFARERVNTLYGEKPAAAPAEKAIAKAPGKQANKGNKKKPGDKQGAAVTTPARQAPPPPRRPDPGSLARLMETTTGMTSIQEALQNDRPLRLLAGADKAEIPVGKLSGPKVTSHPWQEMLQALGGKVPEERMAAVVPAEFYYLRSSSLGALFYLLDQIDAWGTPIAHSLDNRAEDHLLSQRYLGQLGLSRGPLSRSLGPEVITELCLTGSDPYFKMGTDVTLLFRVKSRSLFDIGVQSALSGHAAAHGALTTEKTSQGGVEIRITRSADGAVRQHRASLGEVEVISTSLAALRRVIDAAAGKGKRLSDEPDFQYMLARDTGTRADVLGYLGDRFVAEVIGPRQKILEARRQMALSDLSIPGYAALLHGWLTGQGPASTDELLASGLLSRDELRHPGGQPISFSPGQGARSSWGSPADMVPLIELPQVENVTELEQKGYEWFARSYESNWSRYIDPVALRVGITPGRDGTSTLSADLRVLPLIDGSEYREIGHVVGTTRLSVGPADSGARVVTAIAKDSKWRREVRGLARGFLGNAGIEFDWLGDWAMLGAADKAALAQTALRFRRGWSQRPLTEEEQEAGRSSEIRHLSRLPIYGGIGIHNPAGAVLILAALRKMAQDAAPGMVEWGEHGRHRKVAIVRVGVRAGAFGRSEEKDPINLFYALTGDAFYLSLDEGVLRRLIDSHLSGKAPVAQTAQDRSTQLVLELAREKTSALWTVLSWMLESDVLRNQDADRAQAEILLRGAPERSGDRAGDAAARAALGLAYLGAVPISRDGGTYTMAPEGPRDPVRGSAYAPIWPPLPIPGSPVGKVLSAVSGFRGELSFDTEGKVKGEDGQPMRSLHARVQLRLRD